eukprot:gene2112-4127_t
MTQPYRFSLHISMLHFTIGFLGLKTAIGAGPRHNTEFLLNTPRSIPSDFMRMSAQSNLKPPVAGTLQNAYIFVLFNAVIVLFYHRRRHFQCAFSTASSFLNKGPTVEDVEIQSECKHFREAPKNTSITMFNSKSVVRLLLLGLLLLSTTTAIKKYLRLAKTQAASGGDTGGDGGSNDGDGEDGEGDTGGDGENEPEGHDGEGHRGNDRYYALQALFGSDYTSSPGFVQNYIQQVQQRIVAPVTGGSWTSLGPTTSPSPYLNSGRIRKVISHPNSPGTVFVLASQGGLWKTDNFFDTYPTWLPLTNQLVSTNGGSVSLGSNPDTIYLGLGDPFDFIGVGGIVVISTDGGATWSDPINLGDFYATKQPTVVYDIAVDISTGSDIILVATDVGIFQSTDGGASFNNVYDGGISSIEVYNL